MFKPAQMAKAETLAAVQVTQTEPEYFRAPALTGRAVDSARLRVLLIAEKSGPEIVRCRFLSLDGRPGWLYTDGTLWAVTYDNA